MRTILLLIAAMPLVAAAQTIATSVGRAPARAEFVSYDLREGADSRQRDKAGHVIVLDGKFTLTPTGPVAAFEIPWMWLDRRFFLHVRDAGPEFRLFIDDVQVGYSTDRHTPVEFDVTPYIDEGTHEVRIENDGTVPGEAYLYSQPRTLIEDYLIVCSDAWIDLRIILGNDYNYDETVSVGYDMYDPAGKMVYYNRREATLAGGARDTVRFHEYIPGTGKYLWTPAKPELFSVVLTLWKEGRAIEHIPLRIGFTAKDSYSANLEAIRAAAGRIVTYNAPSDAANAKDELAALKKQGTDMVRTTYPQPGFFYDLCDQIGIRVIDQADINYPAGRDDRTVKGTPSNDPRLLESYLERQRHMLARTRNHTCVVGWSPGTMSGNGYNMYRSYQLLRETDPSRPVFYDDAQGEWNSDI
jgi:beta-galactosidase